MSERQGSGRSQDSILESYGGWSIGGVNHFSVDLNQVDEAQGAMSIHEDDLLADVKSD